MPLVSVIVPIYNGEKNVERLINSLCKQTWSNAEFILVNNASTDHTADEIARLTASDTRFACCYEEKKGVSYARNRGLKEVHGDYVMFVDVDDEPSETLIETLVKAAMRFRVSYCLFGLTVLYRRNGKTVRKAESLPMKEGVFSVRDAEIITSLLESELFNGLHGKLYEAALVRKYEIRFRENLKIQEDLFFNLEYFSHVSAYALVRQSLYGYIRDGQKSLTSQYMPERFDNFSTAFDKILETCRAVSFSEEQRGRIFYIYVKDVWSSAVNVFAHGNTPDGKEKYDAIRQIVLSANEEYLKRARRRGICREILRVLLLRRRCFMVYHLARLFHTLKTHFFLSYQ